MRPYDESLMEACAVSRKVNSVKNDTQECIEAVTAINELRRDFC